MERQFHGGFRGSHYILLLAATIPERYVHALVNLLQHNAPEGGLGEFSFFLGPDSVYHGQLILDLANWTQYYPDSQWFYDPLNHQARNSDYVMILAFNQTVKYLQELLGPPDPTHWDWGYVHKRLLASLFGLLDYLWAPPSNPPQGTATPSMPHTVGVNYRSQLAHGSRHEVSHGCCRSVSGRYLREPAWLV